MVHSSYLCIFVHVSDTKVPQKPAEAHSFYLLSGLYYSHLATEPRLAKDGAALPGMLSFIIVQVFMNDYHYFLEPLCLLISTIRIACSHMCMSPCMYSSQLQTVRTLWGMFSLCMCYLMEYLQREEQNRVVSLSAWSGVHGSEYCQSSQLRVVKSLGPQFKGD